VAWAADELRIVSARARASAHKDQAFGQLGKMRIDPVGERQVRQGAALVDRHFMRIFVDHADQEVSGVLIGRPGSGLPFRQRRNYVMFVSPAIIPGAGKGDLSIHCLPQKAFLAAIHERKYGSGHDRNIGAAN